MFDTDPIYLDYNASTPIDPLVAEAMRPYLERHYGNPSSPHALGLETRNAVEHARKQLAQFFGCQPDEIIFTSGGTESNNMAIMGAAFANKAKGNHIITSSIEHPAVIEVCKYLENHGFEISYLPVDHFGMVSSNDLSKLIKKETILVSVMHANNEVGTIQPISDLSRICREKGILFHTDAAQSLGKVAAKVSELGVDMLSLAGHKLYAPKGIGALYLRKGTVLEKFMHGADHEGDRRAGTENVLEIVGLGKACEIAGEYPSKKYAHMKQMRDLLHNGLIENDLDIKLNGHPELRLPNTLSLGFKNIIVSDLMYGMIDLAVSAGAACHGGDVDSSAVLKAMKVPDEYANGTIRFSVGKYTTREEIEKAVKIIVKAVSRILSE